VEVGNNSGRALVSSQQIALFAPHCSADEFEFAPEADETVFGNVGLAIIFLGVLINRMIASDGSRTGSKASRSSAFYMLCSVYFCRQPGKRSLADFDSRNEAMTGG
jgi:hypothetical protein